MSNSHEVLMLAPVHRAWGNRVVREASSLASAGYRVQVILRCEEAFAREGVDYLPAPAYRSRLGRLLIQPRLFMQALKARAAIYHLHNPDMLLLAVLLKLAGKRVIYDTHEDFSRRLLLRAWIPRPLRKPLGLVVSSAESLISSLVDLILVTQDDQVARMGRRCRLLRNAPVLKGLTMQAARARAAAIERGNVSRLVYVGGISRTRGIQLLLEVLVQLNAQGCATRLWLIGPDLDGCTGSLSAHPGWQFVDYLGLLDHESALAHMLAADIGMAVIADVGDHRSARPTKLFEYMSCGLPFMASDFPLWRTFAGEACGLWVAPDDSASAAEQLQRLLQDPERREHMGRQGQAFVEDFSWEREQQVLLDAYQSIMSHSL